MSDATNASAVWRTDGETATLGCGPLSATFRLDHPEAGAATLAFNGESFAGALLAVGAPTGSLPAASEVYARGADLVSTHPADDAFPYRTQLYWSARPLTVAGGGGAVGVALELSVSLQTDLLDTQPVVTLATRLGETTDIGAEVARVARAAGTGVFIATHPSDAAESSVAVGADGARLTLSPPFLEKGVIRRCHAVALFLPGDPSEADAHAALALYAAAPLSLTT